MQGKLIYPVSELLRVFRSLDERLCKVHKVKTIRGVSKWRRSLYLSMADERHGEGDGDIARHVDAEIVGDRSTQLGVSTARVLTTASESRTENIPGVFLLSTAVNRTRQFTASTHGRLGDPVGYRPSRPSLAPGVTETLPVIQVPVYALGRNGSPRQRLVDAMGNSFCPDFSCQRPFGHAGRHGPWVVCASCRVPLGQRHAPACTLVLDRRVDKPPWMCSRVPFCRRNSGHRGNHRWVGWQAHRSAGRDLSGYHHLYPTRPGYDTPWTTGEWSASSSAP
jgi:hypothetical protein